MYILLYSTRPFYKATTYKKLGIHISVGEGVAGGLYPPWQSKDLLRSGNFPERTIGNSGDFLTALQIALLSGAEILQPP